MRFVKFVLTVVAVTLPSCLWFTASSPAVAAARSSRSVRDAGNGGLTIAERVEAQRAIEQVYWNHRIWPEQNHRPKPLLSAVMSETQLRAKVDDYLKKTRTLTAGQLQAELHRITAQSRDRQVLGELFAALGNDPSLIAQTLARQSLADRAPAALDASELNAPFTLDDIDATGCRFDTWTPLSTAGADPTARHYHTAIWTGAEMIVWGGRDNSVYFNSGGRYNPATDSWSATSTGENVPEARQRAVGVWTGTEMVVWGGFSPIDGFLNSGGRYNPATDAWTPTSTGANVPAGRSRTSGVWTGTEMIVWGGFYRAGSTFYPPEGGRYDPATDTWTRTSSGPDMPSPRAAPTSVWTGSEMIVWGGDLEGPPELNTGGRYDPATDSWTPTSVGADVPAPRQGHTAIWTGSEMIVWGGSQNDVVLGTGGRYDPVTDTWSPTSTGANAPSPRFFTTSAWTGAEMVIWGGYGNSYLQTGGRYDPSSDTWAATSTGSNVPDGRYYHSGVWTGTELLVWSGLTGDGYVNDGGRYCACASPVTAYPDADGDGYGAAAGSIAICGGTLPAGYVANATDCDDSAASIHPGAIETCNGVDDDCDGTVDNGGAAALCDDGNICTDDSCGAALGCVHANNSAACDDGNVCTVGDLCASGACVPGAPAPPPSEVQGVVLDGELTTTLRWTDAALDDVYDIETSTLSDLRANGTATASCLANDVTGDSFVSPQPEPEPEDGYYYLIRAQNVCAPGNYGSGATGVRSPSAFACP